jgi:hypothetical protein
VAASWSVEDPKVHEKVEAAQKVLEKVLYYMSLEDDVWRNSHIKIILDVFRVCFLCLNKVGDFRLITDGDGW